MKEKSSDAPSLEIRMTKDDFKFVDVCIREEGGNWNGWTIACGVDTCLSAVAQPWDREIVASLVVLSANHGPPDDDEAHPALWDALVSAAKAYREATIER